MSYYYPPVNFWSVWFSEIVFRNLEKHDRVINRNDTVLDIGCGLGNHCFSLLRYSPKDIYGFDISSEIIELLKTFSDKVHFINFDICKNDISEFREKFNVVFSCDVYEHVDEPQVMLNNIYSILAPGGMVSITFPNFDDHGHNQIKKTEELAKQLENAGFANYKIEIIEGTSLIYKVFTRMYILIQDISDKIYGIKRNANRMPESDEFHEMYAYKKIMKIKDKKTLVRLINISYAFMKKLGRLSSVYKISADNEDLKDKRIVFWAQK